MSASWFLLAVSDFGASGRGLFDDAEALSQSAQRVEVLVAGDALTELLVGAAPPKGPNIRIVVDGHSYRRRGCPPLAADHTVVESDYVADKLLDPQWKVVWR